jgi:hypothetical protein
VTDLRDPIAEAGAALFTQAALPALTPEIDFGELADSTRNIRWDDSLKISFTKAVDRKAFRGIFLLDASGQK